ncbi:tetratricopeptide repeat protein [Candidatus Sumerlaeota bacterium]|nr:tetratricopeptide repeat protein [Candidatus Sumerlaeota bacterium]
MIFKHASRIFGQFGIWILTLIIAGCTSTQISIHRLEPPKYPIEGGKILAVVNFKSPDYAYDAGEIFASSFVSRLAPTRYYNLMERSHMDQIMAEHRLAQTEYADPNKAIELGKILNADYIITGEVNAFSVEDINTIEREERSRIVGYYQDRRGVRQPRIQTYFVDVPVKIREATVSASFRMVNVETSRIIVGESKTLNSKKRGYGSDGIASLPSRDSLLTGLTDQITDYFTTLIAPHPAQDTRKLEKGKTPKSKDGYRLARSGLWEEATAAWEEALGMRSDDPAPYNNLGVSAERSGDYEKACDYYSQALSLEPKNELYMKHLKNAKQLRDLYNRPYKE